MAELERLRWRCRRGLLELDLVLDGFVRENLEKLTARELETFGRLLDTGDCELWDWISARAEPPDATFAGLIERLRTIRCVA